MRINHASYDDVLAVARGMRESDLEEFLAVSMVDTREALALLLAERYGGRDDVLCGYNAAGEPVCIGGTIEGRPNVLTLLFFATDGFREVAKPLTRFIRGNLFPRYAEAGVHRIEAISLATHVTAHRWLGALGLKQEAPPLRAYGKGREDFLQFSLIEETC
jgi:hypothetical protein